MKQKNHNFRKVLTKTTQNATMKLTEVYGKFNKQQRNFGRHGAHKHTHLAYNQLIMQKKEKPNKTGKTANPRT